MTSQKEGSALRARSGFTLVEALVVVVLLGLIVLIGFPKMSAAMVKSDLRGARTTMINLVATARAASVQSNRRHLDQVRGRTRPTCWPAPGGPAGGLTADTVGTVQNLGDPYGVTVVGRGLDPVRSPRLRRELRRHRLGHAFAQQSRRDHHDRRPGEGHQVRRSRSGFTLIEVLVAVTILAVGVVALAGSAARSPG